VSKFRRRHPESFHAFQLGERGQPIPACPGWYGSLEPGRFVADGRLVNKRTGETIATWGEWVVWSRRGFEVWSDFKFRLAFCPFEGD
jgi:hypothetical protein